MLERDVRLLTATYFLDGNEPVVELAGRTRRGESITILCRGFKPYFHVMDPSDSQRRLLEERMRDGSVLSVEDIHLTRGLEERPALKVTVSTPREVRPLREELMRLSSSSRIYAADILFRLRYLYDNDFSSCVTVRGEPLSDTGRNTDLVILLKEKENIEAFHPELAIMSFDIENSIRTGEIYTIGCVLGKGGKTESRALTGTEEEILRGFAGLVREWDPDVLTGYNIDRYDLAHMEKRRKTLGLPPLKLGRDGSVLREGRGQRYWDINGRIIADAWWNTKKLIRPKRETLNYVAGLLLGEEKDDVNPKEMDAEWARDSEKVIAYCVKDAELALRILEKTRALERSMDLATVSRLPVDEVLNGSSSVLIDSILIREADREGVAVPMTRHSRGREQITGGYVHTIDPGLYHYVNVLDFKSMYPSLIISNNICFSTKSDDGEIASPEIRPGYRVRYVSKDRRVGLVPRILERLMEGRDRTKRMMKETDDPGERDYYDGLQAAIKVLMNSFYGVFASSFYRFTDRDIGASITAFARSNTQRVIRELEEEGLDVIYGDTDSVFYSSPVQNVDGAVEHGFRVSEKFTREGATLEFEKVLNPFFSHGAKKRYVGRIVWPQKDELVIRGYEVRRTDSFNLQSEAMMEVFNRIMDEDVEGAVEVAKDYVTRTRKGQVPIADLVISRTVRDVSDYKNPDSMSNVQAMRKLVKMGHEYSTGMKVSWIVVDSKKTPQLVEPFVGEDDFEHAPDYDYYARRLAQTLGRITEVFDWDEKALLTGSQQTSLFGFGSDDEDGEDGRKNPPTDDEKAKPKREGTTLRDFF